MKFEGTRSKLDKMQVNEWLGNLLWEPSDKMEIYRMKGVLDIHGSGEMHMLQVRFSEVFFGEGEHMRE